LSSKPSWLRCENPNNPYVPEHHVADLSPLSIIYILGAALVAVISWLGKGLFDRVKDLEERSALKTELHDLRSEMREHRRESRETLSAMNESLKQILIRLVG
jgi:uncharacterized membrane-anchored protein YhcB (DUF1043 family)